MTKEQQENFENDMLRIVEENGGVFFKEQYIEANRSSLSAEEFYKFINDKYPEHKVYDEIMEKKLNK